ncbi:MAG: YdcF family protein [Clostridia bacterium]|nr:YdcF family protein [Clostridia bacterium]
MISWMIFILLSLVFVLSVKREPRSFGNCLLLIGMSVSFFNGLIILSGQNHMIHVCLKKFVFVFVPFMIVIISVLLFTDGIYLFWKDHKNLNIQKIVKNLLPPLTGVGLVAGIYLITDLVRQYRLHFAETAVLLFLVYYYVYLAFSIAAFWLYSWFYQQLPRKFSCDYIIVLGCRVYGLDRLSATLMQRLDKAIEVYHKSEVPPIFIVSGGKGADEPVTEAAAMKQYLKSRQIEEKQIMLEDQSRNTYENFFYSKRVLGQTSKKVLFVTSNYHVMRAGICAKKVGLDAQGVGSKTNLFYWPGAFFREYVAVSLRHKTGLIVCGVLWLATITGIYFNLY